MRSGWLARFQNMPTRLFRHTSTRDMICGFIRLELSNESHEPIQLFSNINQRSIEVAGRRATIRAPNTKTLVFLSIDSDLVPIFA